MDLYLEYGGDLQLTPFGSVGYATGWDEVRERIIRRILTNSAQTLPDGSSTPADYIFDQKYGIGGGALVSQNPTRRYIAELKKCIRAGVLADVAVNPGSDPQIVIKQPAANTLTVYVGVTLISAEVGVFSLTTSSQSAGTTQSTGTTQPTGPTQPTPGIFTLDQSLLDGPDVLG